MSVGKLMRRAAEFLFKKYYNIRDSSKTLPRHIVWEDLHYITIRAKREPAFYIRFIFTFFQHNFGNLEMPVPQKDNNINIST